MKQVSSEDTGLASNDSLVISQSKMDFVQSEKWESIIVSEEEEESPSK